MESKRAELLVHMVLAVLIPFVLGSSLSIFNDGDVRWHIAAGQWMLDHGAILKTDPFSFTFRGKPWVAFEWLSEVIYASAYKLSGFAGVSAIVSLALVALHVIVVTEARRHVSLWGAVAVIVLMDLTLIPMMLARPHLHHRDHRKIHQDDHGHGTPQ